MNENIIKLLDESTAIQSAHRVGFKQIHAYITCPWWCRGIEDGFFSGVERSTLESAIACRTLMGRDVYEKEFPNLSVDEQQIVEHAAAGMAYNDLIVDHVLYGRRYGGICATIEGVDCIAEVDFVHPRKGVIIVCAVDDLLYFEADVRRRHADRQAAFVGMVIESIVGEKVPVRLLGVQTKEPFIAGLWELDPSTRSRAGIEVSAAIRGIKRSRERDSWETGYENMRSL